MLGGSEIRVLSALGKGEASIGELAGRLDLSENYVSELVSELEEEDLIYTSRDGTQKLVRAGDHRSVELIQELSQEHPHIDFSELITSKSIPILYYLDKSRTVSELAHLTDSYRNTVHRIVKRFLNRGIIGKSDSHYCLNDDFQKLNDFAREYVSHRHALKIPVDTFNIVWSDYGEFLIGTTEEILDADFIETGPTRFQDFGIPLVTTSKNYYFYSEARDELSASHLVCHTLLVDSGTRYQTYCLLLIQKHGIDRDHLVEAGERYGLEDSIEDLYGYLESRGEVRTESLPEWDRFKSTARQYEVDYEVEL